MFFWIILHIRADIANRPLPSERRVYFSYACRFAKRKSLPIIHFRMLKPDTSQMGRFRASPGGYRR